jgi:hypothetical protein
VESRLTRGTNPLPGGLQHTLISLVPSCRTRWATQCTSTLQAVLGVSINRFRFMRPTECSGRYGIFGLSSASKSFQQPWNFGHSRRFSLAQARRA